MVAVTEQVEAFVIHFGIMSPAASGKIEAGGSKYARQRRVLVFVCICPALQPFHPGREVRRFVGRIAQNLVGGYDTDRGNQNQKSGDNVGELCETRDGHRCPTMVAADV